VVNANRKGKDYERKIANYINKILGTNLRRTPQSGGMEFKGDILDTNPDSPVHACHFELKNQKTIHIPKWRSQCISDCPPGKTPILIFNLNGVDMVVMELNDWLGCIIKDETQ